jgi:competence protein ComEC
MGIDEVDLLVATHPHGGHIGGLDDVLTARPVGSYMDNGLPHTTETYLELMATVERLDVTYLEAVPRSIALGEVTFEVLPMPAEVPGHNDRSVGLLLRFGAFAALLTGDSERTELTRWVDSGVLPDVTLLKAPHHGAANGFTRDFLEASAPEVVVISVGAQNHYLHPRPEALTAYSSVADTVLRTDRDGHVTILGYADGRYDIVTRAEFVTGERIAGAVAAPPSRDLPTLEEPPSLPYATDSFPGEGVGRAIRLSVFANAPGDPRATLNGEYVVLENRAAVNLSIGRWRICDLSTRCFRFPDDARIEAGRRVAVFTGYGMSDGVSFFMNNDRAVWNDSGDEATLYDARGREVLRYVY